MMKKRFIEIDFLRGMAILGMIVYHFLFIGNFYDVFSIDFSSLQMRIFAKAIQFTFLTLVGVSLVLSQGSNAEKYHKRQIQRALQIFAYGMLITIGSWLFVKDRMVVFGILHHIALSVFILNFLVKRKYAALLLAFFILSFGLAIKDVIVDKSLVLNIIGFQSLGFASLDYFPIFPWMSLPAFGVFIGNILYRERTDPYFDFDAKSRVLKIFVLLGKNALNIYLLHIVIIVAVFNLYIYLA